MAELNKKSIRFPDDWLYWMRKSLLIKFLYMHGGITISKCHMFVYIYIHTHTHKEWDSKHDLQVNNL